MKRTVGGTVGGKHAALSIVAVLERLQEPSPTEAAQEARIAATSDLPEAINSIMRQLREQNPDAFARMDRLAEVSSTSHTFAVSETLALSRTYNERFADVQRAVLSAYPRPVQLAVLALLRERARKKSE